MKTKTPFLAAFLGLVFLSPITAPGQPQQQPEQLLAPADMDTLTGPIALYPDALIGIILPASTFSDQIVQAAGFLNSYGAPAQNSIDSQPWDQSVRALARYPDVLQWMNENLAWTQQLGYAFAVQPQDVMDSIQRLRAQAQAVGNLATNAQQTVLAQDNYIRIVPTYQDVIYVPYYDPMLVFYQPVAFGWGPAWAVGPWLVFDCNWVGMSVWFGTWSPRYFLAPPWRTVNRRPPAANYVNYHTWRPARPPARPPVMAGQQRPVVARPAPISGGRAYNSYNNGNTGAPKPGNAQHRPTVPQNRGGYAPAPAATTADMINQSIRPATRPANQPATQTPRTQQPQTPAPGNSNHGNRPVVQHPGTPPPAHYAPQSQGQPAQQARPHQQSQQPQQQVREFGQQPARQPGQVNRAPASNAAPANSSRPAPPSPPPAPPPPAPQQQSTQSTSSSNSPSSSQNSNSQQDSGGRPQR